MRYISETDAKRERVNLDSCGSIHCTGSVRGMQSRYNWPVGGQVRVGSYVYNVGVAEVQRLRDLRVLKGE